MERALSYNNDFDWEGFCRENDFSYSKKPLDYVLGIPFVTSDLIPQGQIVIIEDMVLFGTGELSEREKYLKEIRDEVRRIFLEDPSMRGWYEYAGLI